MGKSPEGNDLSPVGERSEPSIPERIEGSSPNRKSGSVRPKDVHSIPGGYRTDLPKRLIQSFATGDASLVYSLATEIATEYVRMERELSALRFVQNFGSERCLTCPGLRGREEGVVATCVEARLCRYRPVYISDLNPSLIEGMILGSTEPPPV